MKKVIIFMILFIPFVVNAQDYYFDRDIVTFTTKIADRDTVMYLKEEVVNGETIYYYTRKYKITIEDTITSDKVNFKSLVSCYNLTCDEIEYTTTENILKYNGKNVIHFKINSKYEIDHIVTIDIKRTSDVTTGTTTTNTTTTKLPITTTTTTTQKVSEEQNKVSEEEQTTSKIETEQTTKLIEKEESTTKVQVKKNKITTQKKQQTTTQYEIKELSNDIEDIELNEIEEIEEESSDKRLILIVVLISVCLLTFIYIRKKSKNVESV